MSEDPVSSCFKAEKSEAKSSDVIGKGHPVGDRAGIRTLGTHVSIHFLQPLSSDNSFVGFPRTTLDQM